MTTIDHYAALGVARDADPEVIRAAYRALAKKYHPDSSVEKSPEALRRFRQINEAHTVLSDSAARARYDGSLDDKHSRGKDAVARSHQSYAEPKARTPPIPAERSSLEKVRNGIVVIGWFLIGGFALLMVLAIVLGGLILAFLR
jgi:curved DNA-binding protein CbpA